MAETRVGGQPGPQSELKAILGYIQRPWREEEGGAASVETITTWEWAQVWCPHPFKIYFYLWVCLFVGLCTFLQSPEESWSWNYRGGLSSLICVLGIVLGSFVRLACSLPLRHLSTPIVPVFCAFSIRTLWWPGPYVIRHASFFSHSDLATPTSFGNCLMYLFNPFQPISCIPSTNHSSDFPSHIPGLYPFWWSILLPSWIFSPPVPSFHSLHMHTCTVILACGGQRSIVDLSIFLSTLPFCESLY